MSLALIAITHAITGFARVLKIHSVVNLSKIAHKKLSCKILKLHV